MKEITQAEISKLIDGGYIRNTYRGYVNAKTNSPCGFYRTRTKRYIEDKYANIAKRLK